MVSNTTSERDGEERWTKARAIILLRLTLVIATSYLLLVQGQPLVFDSAPTWLILAALASNLPFFWLSRETVESARFAGGLIVVDTLWITAILYSSGYVDVDFYVFYFFVLFLAAISENLKLMTLGTVLISAGYLYAVFAVQGAQIAWSSPTLMRLPFFFAVTGLYGFLADRVRREREAGERLLQIARRDPLTDLANRRRLEELLEEAISRSVRTGQRIALLLFDLDDFKAVNDTYGHAVGDQLLIALAERLRSSVRRIDSIGRFRPGDFDAASRLGGDEFAVVLTSVKSLGGIAQVAQRLGELICEPVRLDSLEITTTASVGIAVMGGETEPEPPADAEALDTLRQGLLAQADRALYQAKEEGRNTYRFHDQAMDREITLRRSLSQDLRGVQSRDHLLLEFQPQVDLDSFSITGAEALVRWQHPVRGLISPADFIPIAEGSGHIKAIGDWILREACREASAWRKIYPNGIPVAVNFSAIQFKDPDFVARVAEELERQDLPPHLLELELTEGVLLKLTDKVLDSLVELRERVGVGISLDDFGRGFSSLEYLCQLPIDKLKIDRLFVNSIGGERDTGAIVRTIIALGKSLELVTVAEGVETETQLEFLRAHGCERAQGYYFRQPVPAEVFRDLLRRDRVPRIEPTLLAGSTRSST